MADFLIAGGFPGLTFDRLSEKNKQSILQQKSTGLLSCRSEPRLVSTGSSPSPALCSHTPWTCQRSVRLEINAGTRRKSPGSTRTTWSHTHLPGRRGIGNAEVVKRRRLLADSSRVLWRMCSVQRRRSVEAGPAVILHTRPTSGGVTLRSTGRAGG